MSLLRREDTADAARPQLEWFNINVPLFNQRELIMLRIEYKKEKGIEKDERMQFMLKKSKK